VVGQPVNVPAIIEFANDEPSVPRQDSGEVAADTSTKTGFGII
jgi:hypothetical protein